MTLSELVLSFAVSIAANDFSNLKTFIKGDNTLENKINCCFKKALGKWDIPPETRDFMKLKSANYYIQLEEFIKNPAKGIHPKIKELLNLWVKEMQNEPVCNNFILSHKLDILSQKNDALLSQLKDFVYKSDQILENTNSIDEGIKVMDQDIKKILDSIQRLTSESDTELKTKIEGILNGTVTTLIESLKLESSRNVVLELESQFSKIIENSVSLKALVLFCKGKTWMYSDSKLAFELFHKAYELDPQDKRYIRTEVLYQIARKDYANALELLDLLPEETKYLHLVRVLMSTDIKTAYMAIPLELKTDYEFNQLLLVSLEKEYPLEVDILFHDENIKLPFTFAFSTLNAWLFAITKARVNAKDFIALSFEAPQIKEILPSLKVLEVFYNNLNKTEIRDSFPLVKGLYCYWKFITSQNAYWLDEFQKLDHKGFGCQRPHFEIMETSMLILSKRYEEATSTLISCGAKIVSTFVQLVIMVSFISKSNTLLQWILDKAKVENLKLDTKVSNLLAQFITKENAAEIKDIISRSDFVIQVEKLLLVQLCNYFNGSIVDVSTFKDQVTMLDDNLKAYAANLLVANGDNQLAYEMLRPIVDENVQDFRQQVYLKVLDHMAEKKPELYHILKNNRNCGHYCADNLLWNEFQLACRISDYKNAFEPITLLYHRHTEEIDIFAYFLQTLGHVNPEKLCEYEEKAQKLHIDNSKICLLIYSAFSENNYSRTAAEILYRFAKSTDDVRMRTFYYEETTLGHITNIARQEKEIAEEGDFVLCEINGEQKFYKATKKGTKIGNDLLGVYKNNVIETEIAFRPVSLTVKGIHNKYYKLSFDILKEAQDGNNPELQPIHIDTDHPVESIEDFLTRFTGDNISMEERTRLAYADYSAGKLTLFNLIDFSNPISSYYKLLFTPFRVNVNCSQIEIQQMTTPNKDSLFILDIPSIILLVEFSAKTEFGILGPMAVTTLHYDLIDSTRKTMSKFINWDFCKALESASLVKYNEYVDLNAQMHMDKLLSWIKEKCKIIVPDASLALDENIDDVQKMLLIGSIAMLTKPNYYYVTDDINLKKIMPSAQIIGTETFVKYFNPQEVSNAYSRFLFECDFRGVELDEEYILQEYVKAKQGCDNRMISIMQNASKNPFIIHVALSCCMKLANTEIDKSFLKLTFTNLLTIALKEIEPKDRRLLWDEVERNFLSSYYPAHFAKVCFQDALLILNQGHISV